MRSEWALIDAVSCRHDVRVPASRDGTLMPIHQSTVRDRWQHLKVAAFEGSEVMPLCIFGVEASRPKRLDEKPQTEPYYTSLGVSLEAPGALARPSKIS